MAGDLMKLFQCSKLHARITLKHCESLRARPAGGDFFSRSRPPQCNGCEEWMSWDEDENGIEVDMEVTVPTKEKMLCAGCGEMKILQSKTHCHKCNGELRAKKKAAMREQLADGPAEPDPPEEKVVVPEIVVDEAADVAETLPAVAQGAPPAGMERADGVQILFADHPDLMEKLRDLAAGEFRSPEQQILYLVNREAARTGLVNM